VDTSKKRRLDWFIPKAKVMQGRQSEEHIGAVDHMDGENYI